MSPRPVTAGSRPVTLPSQRGRDTRSRARHASSSRSGQHGAGPRRAGFRRRHALLAAAVLVAIGLGGVYWVAEPATLPAPGTTFVRDDMARTVAGGWGAASVGGAYRLTEPRSGSVTPGAAALKVGTPGSSNAAVLDTSSQDTAALTTLSMPVLPESGDGVVSSILLRPQGDGDTYQAMARIRSRGEVWLSFSRRTDGAEVLLGPERDTGIALAPGQPLNLEAEVVGTDTVVLRSRVWLMSAVPPAWQHEVSDGAVERIGRPGGVGLMVSLPGTSPAPATVRFAGLTAGVPDPSGAGAVTSSVVPFEAAATTSPPTQPPGSAAAAAAATGGSAPLGSTAYPVPPDAVVASPAGNDNAAGTIADPVLTVERAISIASNGRTVVLRGGSYHEKVQIPASKRLTLQSYPNEQVWFDGSSVVTGWVPSGSTWVRDGWTTEFDSTPCYNAGRCNTTNTAFQFVGSAAPMAAHPDQMWIDGEPLQQVTSVDQVSVGSFYVDYQADRLYIGRDPADRDVRASDLVDAIAIRSEGSTIRGLGVRRYATPLPKIATVKADAEGVTLENLVVSDNATAGVSITQANCTVRNVSSVRNGMLGFHVSYADRTTLSGVLAEGNNTERFKQAPVAGGVKIGRSRSVAVVDSSFVGNDGAGVWFDESVYDIIVKGNTIARNSGHGLVLELSAKAVVVDNFIAANGRDGLKVNNTDGVQVWNNTFVGNSRTVWVVQDSRLASDVTAPGHDPRQSRPDPTVTWIAGAVTISNNIFSKAAAGSPCVLCVEDTTDQRSASVMQVVANGNVYNRSAASSPPQLVVWSSGPGDPQQFATVEQFTSATGQERNSVAADGPPFVTDDGTVVGTVPDDVAQPLPDDVARHAARPAGSRHVGLWTD